MSGLRGEAAMGASDLDLLLIVFTCSRGRDCSL